MTSHGRFAIGSAIALSAAALGVAAAPSTAEACGGCFAPSEQVTVVTGHRMAVAMSATETTLWDQIEYAGDPEDFVWVLPIQGEVLVELADNAFFEALDQATRITLQGTFPPLNTFCPDPCGGDALFGRASDSGGRGPGAEPPPVTVYGEAVVGPYETATIGSTDPGALLRWLQERGYGVPDSILPIIAHYVELGMNFAVLRLNPNAGVNQMQPVRVTTPGMNPIFPLKMVAAGVEGSVGLELYVFGEGRSEAQNFDIVEIDARDLAYDWATSRFNYDDAFAEAITRAGGRAWVAEYAQPDGRHRYLLESYAFVDEDGEERSSRDDFAVVTRTIPFPYVTKLRTDIDAAHLDEDLVLQAALGGDVETFINVDRELNRPPEPRCPTTCTDPTRPGGGAVGGPGSLAFGGSGRGAGLCAVSLGSDEAPVVLGLGLAVAVSALTLRRRRRR